MSRLELPLKGPLRRLRGRCSEQVQPVGPIPPNAGERQINNSARFNTGVQEKAVIIESTCSSEKDQRYYRLSVGGLLGFEGAKCQDYVRS